MSNFNSVLLNIQQWVKDRKFKEGASLVMQQVKGQEEFAETAAECFGQYQNMSKRMDGIGDSVVVLVAQCEIAGIELSDIFVYDYGNPLESSNLAEAALMCVVAHGHMAKCIAKNKPKEELAFHMRYFFQCLCHLAQASGVSIVECAEHAYDEIKNRKGIWSNGSFIKEGDY